MISQARRLFLEIKSQDFARIFSYMTAPNHFAMVCVLERVPVGDPLPGLRTIACDGQIPALMYHLRRVALEDIVITWSKRMMGEMSKMVGCGRRQKGSGARIAKGKWLDGISGMEKVYCNMRNGEQTF